MLSFTLSPFSLFHHTTWAGSILLTALLITANARLLFGPTVPFETVVCESERLHDSKPLWTARLVRPDLAEVYLEGRTHRDFCSALYGLLSETARVLEFQLQGVVGRYRDAMAVHCGGAGGGGSGDGGVQASAFDGAAVGGVGGAGGTNKEMLVMKDGTKVKGVAAAAR